MFLFLIYFFLVTGISFLCSILESVFLSVTPVFIQVLIKKGYKSGRIYQDFKKRPNHALAAILTFNTIANTMGASLVGVQALKVFGQQWVAVCSAVLTFVILVFSEVVPKTIGTLYWRKFASQAVYLIKVLTLVLYPFVTLLEYVSRMLAKTGYRHRITREEFLASAELGKISGALKDQEASIIKNLLLLNNIYVKDVFTPRSVMLAFEQEQTVDDIVKKNSPLLFSRIPVFASDMDNIEGYVLRYHLIQAFSQGRGADRVKTFLNPIHTVPLGASVANVLDLFIKREEHIFLVVDEYGGTAGIITLEDAIETLLGTEIVDEFDSVEDMRKLALRKLGDKRGQRFGTQSRHAGEDFSADSQ